MTEKELRKLHRHDLLELLVEQSREAARLSMALQEKEEELAATLESNERIKGKLDEKDALIEKLKSRLDEKDAEMTENAAAAEEQLNGKDTLIEKLKSRLDEKDTQMAEEAAHSEENFSRLKEKLDAKDALIEKLRTQAERRDEKIERLETETERLRSNRWKEMKESGLPPELLERLKTLL